MTEILYKFTGVNGAAVHGGSGFWNLPHGKRPGKWMPKIKGDLAPCQNGYHLCRQSNLIKWLASELYRAECRGERMNEDDKVVARESRLLQRITTWNDRTARLFACDCAEHVLPIFELAFPEDLRPRLAIQTARRLVNGDATLEELVAARAAGAAARDAGDAARAAGAAGDVAMAAGVAAWVAGDAARAAGADAGDAEEQWQLHRLCEYLEEK